MMSFASAKKIAFIKSRNMFSVNVYEELQRAVSQPEIIRDINHQVTGGRSNNVINYLLFNSASIFDSDDADMSRVTGNISTWVVGYVEKDVEDILVNKFSLQEIQPYIELIRKDQGRYHNYFVTKFDTGKTRDTSMIKVDLPYEVVMSDLFQTRTVVDV
jgi:hypothetical protein